VQPSSVSDSRVPTTPPGARAPEYARPREARKVARRSFLRVSIFAGLALTIGSGAAAALSFFNVRQPRGFGGVVTVPAALVPRPGQEPVRVSQGKFWLSNLSGDEGDVFERGGRGGLLAMYWKCPHLGCTVPWNAAFDGAAVNFPGITGWFRCPCHGSTYSRAGVRVYGPAPRSLDLMGFSRNSDGSVSVETGQITAGSLDNPLKTIAYT